MIYLDHNATTPIDPRVTQAMSDCLAAGHANPASAHAAGRAARRVLEAARDGIARLLGANISSTPGDQIVFTSGGTEANNLAIQGTVSQPPGRVVISAIEHPSVGEAAQQLQSRGFDVRIVGVDSDGIVRTDQLDDLVNEQTRVVSVMTGNHETGVLQPIPELARICHEKNVPLHTDAVQVVGKLPIEFDKLGVAMLSASAHKFHGPCGVGALVVRRGTRIRRILHGGFQQGGLRPGSESVELAVGMHTALELWHSEAEKRYRYLERLRDRLQERLTSGKPDAVVVGRAAPRTPHTLNISFPGFDRQALIMALDQRGICCSTGSACASGSSEPSPVLTAMNCPGPVIAGSLRFSLGTRNTEAEIDQAAEIILRVTERIRPRYPSLNSLGSARGLDPKPL